MALIDSIIIFLVSLGIGALGIHIGSEVILEDTDFGKAVMAALIGAIVWAIVSFFIGGIPLLGPILTLVAWIGVINYFYRGGWMNAAAIGLLAWVTVSVILYLLAALDITTIEALGVPESA